jgi:hypothetical protein
MSCNVGTRVKDLYKCGSTLIIGTAPSANTAYLVYFKNWTTGKTFVVSTTSAAGTGVITITLPTDMLDADHDYQVWVTLASAVNLDTKQNITISSVVYTSFAVYFRTVYDSTQSAVEDLAAQSFIPA